MDYQEKIKQDVEKIKSILEPRLGKRVSLKIEFRKRNVNGIAEKFDTAIFGGFDFGCHEVLILKQPTKRLAIKLLSIEEVKK